MIRRLTFGILLISLTGCVTIQRKKSLRDSVSQIDQNTARIEASIRDVIDMIKIENQIVVQTYKTLSEMNEKMDKFMQPKVSEKKSK